MKTRLILYTLCTINLQLLAQTQFEKRYTGMGGSDAKCIRQTLDSGYIVVGGESQPVTFMTVLKTNDLGDTVWTKDITDPPAFGFSVAQTLDTGYIVSGYAFDPTSRTILIKLDQNGQVEWQQTYENTISEWGQAVMQLSDSSILIAGARIFKTDIQGNVLWSQATATGNQAMSMIETSDGNVLYTQTSSAVSSGTWLTKMDTSGSEIWTKSYSTLYTHNNCDNNVAETSDGGYILAGQSSSEIKGMLLKLDGNGSIEWSEDFQPGNVGSATSVVESDSGGFLACGYKVDSEGIHAYLYRTDEDGDVIWEKEYEKSQAQSLITTYDGGYAFAGYRENNSGKQKYLIVKMGGKESVSIAEVGDEQFKLYPTISDGNLSLRCQSCYGKQADIYDLSGRLLTSVALNKSLNLSNLSEGSYFLVSEEENFSAYFSILH